MYKFLALELGWTSATQNNWVFGLFPSSGILGTRKHDVSETRSVSVLRFWGKTATQLGPLDRANLNYWKTSVIFTQMFNGLRPG
jgi:hypothetical protein